MGVCISHFDQQQQESFEVHLSQVKDVIPVYTMDQVFEAYQTQKDASSMLPEVVILIGKVEADAKCPPLPSSVIRSAKDKKIVYDQVVVEFCQNSTFPNTIHQTNNASCTALPTPAPSMPPSAPCSSNVSMASSSHDGYDNLCTDAQQLSNNPHCRWDTIYRNTKMTPTFKLKGSKPMYQITINTPSVSSINLLPSQIHTVNGTDDTCSESCTDTNISHNEQLQDYIKDVLSTTYQSEVYSQTDYASMRVVQRQIAVGSEVAVLGILFKTYIKVTKQVMLTFEPLTPSSVSTSQMRLNGWSTRQIHAYYSIIREPAMFFLHPSQVEGKVGAMKKRISKLSNVSLDIESEIPLLKIPSSAPV